jgi:hypothetical protein
VAVILGLSSIRKERESLSFFDEADEPRAPRTTPGSRRSPGGGRRPPTDQQSIQIRRAIAAIVIIVLVVLIILGIHSCQVSARNSALRDYSNSVNSIIQRSKTTSDQLFGQLSNITSSNAANVEQQVLQRKRDAQQQLNDAQALSVPSETRSAQANLLLTLQMRRDAIANIASQIQPASNAASSKQAINTIALQMARFYASDVVYKDYTIPLIASALNAALGTNNGASYNPAQFLPNLGWLTPTYVASQLKVSVPQAPNAKCVAGQAVGHHINSVSVAGTTLQTGSTNTIAASPAPTFTINITNGGQVAEANVMLKVTVEGTSVSGHTTIPQTTPGQSTSGQVTLSSQPPTGQYTVQAEVVPVHCETNTTRNYMSFPVTFQ